MAGELSKEEFETWWPISQVVKMLPTMGWGQISSAIAHPIQDGLVHAAAETFLEPQKPLREYVLIGPAAWVRWAWRSADEEETAFWNRGFRKVYDGSSTGYGEGRLLVTLYGVRLRPSDVKKHILAPFKVDDLPSQAVVDALKARIAELEEALARKSEAATQSSGNAPAKSWSAVLDEAAAEWGDAFKPAMPKQANQKRRGPKPKSFWGDAMAAMEASISAGELLASSQADIERAMAQWIGDQGYDAGESTIRNYAKPVWERVSREGQ
jgi:hypothetical protein